MPTTFSGGRPETCCSTPTMASSGLVTTMTKASGQCCLMALADADHHLGVDADQVVAAHARLARHAGRDDDHVGARDVGVVAAAAIDAVERPRPAPLGRCRAPCPAARHRRYRTRTISPNSFMPANRASVPPIWPAPTSAIFLRAMVLPPCAIELMRNQRCASPSPRRCGRLALPPGLGEVQRLGRRITPREPAPSARASATAASAAARARR